MVNVEGSLSADLIAQQHFGPARRGFDPDEVRAFLAKVAAEIVALHERQSALEAARRDAEYRAAHPSFDEETLLGAVGDETAQILKSAHEAAGDIKSRAEENASRILKDAHQQAEVLRGEAETVLARRTEEAEGIAGRIKETARAEAERLVDQARQQSKAIRAQAEAERNAMIEGAQATRERILSALSKKRNVAVAQVEQLRAGRERLLEAYQIVRRTLDEATGDLARAESEARAAADAIRHRPLTLDEPDGLEEEGDPTNPTLPIIQKRLRPVRNDAAPDAPPPPRPAPESAVAASAPAAKAPLPPSAATTSGPIPITQAAAAAPAPAASPSASPAALAPAPAAAANPAPAKSGPTATPPPPAAPSEGRPAPLPTATAVPAAVAPSAPANANPAGLPSPTPADRPVAAQPTPTPKPSPAPVVVAAPTTAQPPKPTAAQPPKPAGAQAASPTPQGDAPGTQTVDSLFARIRADRAQAVAHAHEVLAEDRPVADTDEALLQRRDEVVEPIEANLTRRLKRALQDDQNDLLDRLRGLRSSQKAIAVVLPAADAHAARFRDASRPFLAEAVTAGATFIATLIPGVRPAEYLGGIDHAADELAEAIVDPLRRRLESVLEAGEGDDPVVLAEAVGGAYREWKTKRVEVVAADHVAGAFTAGAYAATPTGTPLRWLVEDIDGPCPDCDDNVLAGAQPKGEPFPTGQKHPPAHPGCRCLLVPQLS
jgi:DivIVA domain-containing protein